MLIHFAMSHGAHSGVMCRLRNDDLITTLVDVHNLNSFGCHHVDPAFRSLNAFPTRWRTRFLFEKLILFII